jgi:hypothetical protein
MKRVGIFLVVVCLVVGMIGCVGGDGNNGDGSYTLIVDLTVGGTVTVDDLPIPGKAILTYDAGTVVSLNATPSAGYRFTEWTGNVSTIADINAASTTITMHGSYKVTANFEANSHSTYKIIYNVPEVIVACEETKIPVTLENNELGELGYDGVQLHVKVYPRAGDVTIKLYFWSFNNELYSGEFDLPAVYNKTIYPLVHFSEPGEYTFIFSLIVAPYGSVVDNMTESITVDVVDAKEVAATC